MSGDQHSFISTAPKMKTKPLASERKKLKSALLNNNRDDGINYYLNEPTFFVTSSLLIFHYLFICRNFRIFGLAFFSH